MQVGYSDGTWTILRCLLSLLLAVRIAVIDLCISYFISGTRYRGRCPFGLLDQWVADTRLRLDTCTSHGPGTDENTSF